MAIKLLNNIDVTGEVEGTSLDINGNADIAGNLSLSGDNRILNLAGGTTSNQSKLIIGEQGVYGVSFRWDSGADLEFDGFWNSDVTGTSNRDLGRLDVNNRVWRLNSQVIVGGELEALSLDINGNADISGNLTGVDSLTMSGDLSGSNNMLSSFFMPQNPEGNHIKAPWFFNDMAYARLRGATVTVTVNGGSAPGNNEIDAMFDASTGFWNMATSGVTSVVIEMTNPPKTMNHGAHYGVTFGNSHWRANSVDIDTYYSGAYQEVVSTTTNSKEFVYGAKNSSGNSVSKIKWTFSDFNTTSMRIVSLLAYNYNATGMPSLYLAKNGGDMYGAIAMGNNNITGAGTITGTTLTGTSLDINGAADISGNLTTDGTLSGNFVVRSTNNSNTSGANFAVDTTNKSSAEYAYEVLRSGTTVAGITTVGKITGTELEGTSLDINGNADISGTLVVSGADAITIPDYILHTNDNSKFGFPSNDNFKVRLAGTDVFNMSTSVMSFTGEIEGGSLDINGNGDVSGNLNVNGSITTNGAGVNGNLYANRYIQNATGVPTNNLGAPTVTEMALFEQQFKPQTTLANGYNNLDDLKFYQQDTSSSSWVEITSYSDDQKRRFLRTMNSSVIIPNTTYKFRVEFVGHNYTFANALSGYWSSNSHNTQVHIWKRRCSDNLWQQHTSSSVTVGSWPGHLYLPFSTIAWHETNTSSTGHHNKIRIEFTPNWVAYSGSGSDYSANNINIYGLQVWGGYPSGKRTVHNYDQNGKLDLFKDLGLPDSGVATFGNSDDLKIYHDGSNSYIEESGSGNLKIRTNALNVMNAANSENLLSATQDGSVNLYYNNSEKLKTTNTGVEVTGTITAGGTTLTGDQDLSSLVTLSGGQTISGNKNFTGSSNQFNGHIYFNAYDANGNHYPHYRDGSANDGANINIRHYYGSNYKTHVMSSDSSGNMQFDFQGTYKGDALDIDGNADISGNLTGVDTLTATTFSGDLNGTINTATTATTQSASNNSTKVATTAYVDAQVATVVDSAPGTLDTLNELAAALGDDASFSTTVTNSIATKLPKSGGTMTGDISMGNRNITNVNVLTFNDPGPNEGLSWSGGNMKLYESPNDLTTNTAGNLQIVYGSTRRLTVDNSGIDVNGTTTSGGSITVSNGSHIGLTITGSGSSHTQGAILLKSGTDSTPEARGQGIFLFNEGDDATWYTGTQYQDADTWMVARKAGTSVDTSAATDAQSFLKINNSGDATFAGGLTIPDYINHTGDSGTKFGFSADDTFVVRTGGAVRLTVNDTSATFAGNVDIGSVFGFNTTTDLLTITNNQNTGGINFAGGNSRIYFSGYRAIEGSTNGSSLSIGEGYGLIALLDNVEVTGELQADSLDIDGNADISGALTLGTVLAAAEGGTGLSSISTLLNSNVTTTTLGAVKGTHRVWTSVVSDPGTDAWYKIFTTTDHTSTPVECHLRGYAHTSISFIVSDGYQGGGTHINILDAHVSSDNGSYKYIKGIRVNSLGDVEVLLNSGSNVSVEITVIGDAVVPSTLAVSAVASPTIKDSITTLSNGMIRAAGVITATGKITGTELEGTSLDINGNADISGTLTLNGLELGAVAERIRNVGDTDSYIDFGGADTINFATNNANRLVITNSAATFAGNIALTGGGTIEAPSSNGNETLNLVAAGGINLEIDSNGNTGDDQYFKIYKHSIGGTELFSVKETGDAVVLGELEAASLDINGAAAINGKVVIEGDSAAWNETTPGTTTGSLHFDPGSGNDNFGNAITFGASDTGGGANAQAGIYTRSDGAYGTKMYFATTDNYSTGSKVAMYIDKNKDVYFNDDINVAGEIEGASLDINGNADISGNLNVGDYVHWDLSAGEYSGDPRAVVMGYSGGNYGQLGYNIAFTSTGGAHNRVFNDIPTRIDLHNGIVVYASAAGSAGTSISWTEVLEAQTDAFQYKGQDIYHTGNNSGILNSNVTLATLGAQAAGSYLTASSTDLDSRYYTETESDARYLQTETYTAHENISQATSNLNNSGRTYIQDITLDSNGHVTGVATATETVTQTTNTFRAVEVDSSGNGSADYTLGNTETLRFKKGSNISMEEAGGVVTISSTDTNTTYSVGDGGLTQNNFTNADHTKLDGIATSATANSSDATLKARANHTGTQTASTISDFDTEVANNSAVAANTAKVSNVTQTSVTGNAGSVTNGVYTNTTQTISGAKTFSNTTNFSGAMSQSDTTQSTTKSTGAYKTLGGVGIAKTLNVGEDVVAYASSDKRYKDNLQAITNPIDKVKSLTGYTFTWNDKHEQFNGNDDIGVVAQEVEKVFPEIVDTRDNGYKAVKYEKMVAVLIEAVKDQQKQIDELKEMCNGCSK